MHRDLPDTGLRQSGGCRLFRHIGARFTRDFSDPDRLLFHDCDTGVGSSGSPMLRNGKTGPEVVAMNIGTYVVAKTLIATDGSAREESSAVANTAVPAGAFMDAPAHLLARDLIQSRAELRTFQMALRERGFYVGLATGQMNGALEQAIRRYERSLGRPETGLLDRALMLKLSAGRSNPSDADQHQQAASGLPAFALPR